RRWAAHHGRTQNSDVRRGAGSRRCRSDEPKDDRTCGPRSVYGNHRTLLGRFAMTNGKKYHCMTCLKDYESGTDGIHTLLDAFGVWCICRDCIEIYQKRKAAEKGGEH